MTQTLVSKSTKALQCWEVWGLCFTHPLQDNSPHNCRSNFLTPFTAGNTLTYPTNWTSKHLSVDTWLSFFQIRGSLYLKYMHTAFSLTPCCAHIFSIHLACCLSTWTLCWRGKKVMGYLLVLCNFVRATPSFNQIQDVSIHITLYLRHPNTSCISLSQLCYSAPSRWNIVWYLLQVDAVRRKSCFCMCLKCSLQGNKAWGRKRVG